MSLLLEIQKQIEIAQSRVRLLEVSLRDHPSLPSVAANLESAVRIQRRLEAQFQEQAAQVGYDICTYRAFDNRETPQAGHAFGAIAKFQSLVSVVYAALKHGRKQRATIPEDVEAETAFGFGYAFTGSVGVVLTVRNERVLLGGTMLDDSLDAIFAMAQSSTAEQIQSLAARIGVGPVNTLYEWADTNARHGLGADIEWRKGAAIQRHVIVQHQELARLRNTIKSTGEETEETVAMTGVLIMADVSRNRFKLRRQGLPDIRGTVATTIDDAHRVSLPKTYMATILKKVRTNFSTGAETIRYHLLRLDEPTPENCTDDPDRK